MAGGDRIAVGVDVGGTKLAAGVVRADGAVLRRLRRQTPATDPEAIVAAIVAAVFELSDGVPGVPVGVGAAGLIDPHGTVRYAPNIAWSDFPLRARLVDALDGPVTVDNDANTAAWAEHRCGAGRGGGENLVMLTIGTGVGGGMVLGGRLLRGSSGLGAELGHMIVCEGGPLCSCGNRGCLESLASGTAIGRYATERRAGGALLERSPLATGPVRLTGKVVTAAAEQGDSDALEILEQAGFWIGVGIASLVNALDPDVVVVGGGAMRAGELLLATAREAAAARIVGVAQRTPPPIVAGALGDDGGLVGAALLALGA